MILTATTALKKISRMALEIAERNINEKELIILGIKTNGLVLARKVAEQLSSVYAGKVTVAGLEIDKKNPGNIKVDADIDVAARTVIICDDVANSGRTMLYAIKPLLDAYPKSIQTLALVERTHKLFPVDVDFKGISVSTTPNQHIEVIVENDEVQGAVVVDG